jgi:hypothetical protein
VFGACVVGAALVVAGCTSGGGKSSTPATVGRSPTPSGGVTGAPGGGTGPKVAAENLGPCPSHYANAALKELNYGTKGIGETLVPISASEARICEYERSPGFGGIGSLDLSASRLLKSQTAAAFGAETSRLPQLPARFRCTTPTPAPLFFVTFASETESVGVWEEGGCGYKTNGLVTVRPTRRWLNELQRLTTPTSVAVPIVVGKSCSDALVDLSELGFVSAPTGALCRTGVVIDVIAQNPKAGALVPRRTTVAITLRQLGAGPTGPVSPAPTGAIPTKPAG